MNTLKIDPEFDPEKFKRLIGGVTHDEETYIDPFNNELNRRISRHIEKPLSVGIHRLNIGGDEFIIYYKFNRVIAGVNVNNLDEYCQCSYALSPFLNVLFRELGSAKTVRLGFDSEVIHDDDLYSLYDNFKDYKTDFSRIRENSLQFLKMERKLVINVNNLDGTVMIRMTCDDGLHIDALCDMQLGEIKRTLQRGGFQIFEND